MNKQLTVIKNCINWNKKKLSRKAQTNICWISNSPLSQTSYFLFLPRQIYLNFVEVNVVQDRLVIQLKVSKCTAINCFYLSLSSIEILKCHTKLALKFSIRIVQRSNFIRMCWSNVCTNLGRQVWRSEMRMLFLQWFHRSNVCVMAALHVEMSQQAIERYPWSNDLCSTIPFENWNLIGISI